MIETGLDRLLAAPDALEGRRFGLLSHSAALSRRGALAPLALARVGVPPHRLFGPEHGFYGVEQDMVASEDAIDPWLGVPICSLYGHDEASLRPTPEAFHGLDLLVVDLQDIGTRYYTYAATAVWAAEVALETGLEVWVLDRPNPLGGERIEGPGVDVDLRSFVGAFDLPVRHGLTLGELVGRELRQRRTDRTGLRIWAVDGWERSATWDPAHPWAAPSPNMPGFDVASVYPGLCLVEATRVSEGRGTTRPFLWIGAPDLEVEPLLATLDPAGASWSPHLFRPQFQKHAGRLCRGLALRAHDPDGFSPLRCGVELIAGLYRQYGPELWRRAPYEFVSDRPAIDLLTGSSTFRRRLEAGQDWEGWADTWSENEAAFRRDREQDLLSS